MWVNNIISLKSYFLRNADAMTCDLQVVPPVLLHGIAQGSGVYFSDCMAEGETCFWAFLSYPALMVFRYHFIPLLYHGEKPSICFPNAKSKHCWTTPLCSWLNDIHVLWSRVKTEINRTKSEKRYSKHCCNKSESFFSLPNPTANKWKCQPNTLVGLNWMEVFLLKSSFCLTAVNVFLF